MKRFVLVSAALLLATISVPVVAQVQFNVNIGSPPPVVLASPPTMLYLPQPGLYAAVGVPYDIYYAGDRYYYYRDSNWFWAPGYGGPWTYASYRSLPPVIREYRIGVLRDYRDREYRVYRVNAPRFEGRHFVASYGPGSRGRGRGHSKH
jgi:hypothetical protein